VTYLDDEDMEQTVSAADWLLYGDTQVVVRNGQDRRVYFKTTDCANPGVLGLRWPRFENRNPGLDLLMPHDPSRRPIHVVRKNKEVFRETQWEQALFNLRVIDKATGKKVLPDTPSLNRLREIYESSKRSPKKPKNSIAAAIDTEKTVEIKITESVLNKWAKEFANRYELIEDQPELVSRTGEGRAKFSTATLRNLRQVLESLSAGQTLDSIQPLLREPSESKEVAMQKFLGGIRHGLVRHRLSLFLRLLRRLISEHKSKPDFIVVEAVRSLAFSTKKKEQHIKDQKKTRQDREGIYQKLKDEDQSTSKDAILRYRLAVEAGFKCPFCLDTFTQADLYNGDVDISHLYPKSLAPCNEFYNLTAAHAKCNRTDMEAKIPRDAFGSDPIWPHIEANARKRFSDKKRELFLAQSREEAEKLIESKASLVATAYISKMVRRLCLIELEWLDKDGRDPTNKEGNIPSMRFLVTNGGITGRLRQAWELNEILHPTVPDYTDGEWGNLSA
ncbi:MAG: type II CRISPR RNA-guided endonuclease Cas9, partial [Pirellulaceae bacterium]